MFDSFRFSKCIFCVLFGSLPGHVVCKEGVLVDPTKIVFIINHQLLQMSISYKQPKDIYDTLEDLLWIM